MSDGHFVERGTLDLWDDTMRDQRNRIEELEKERDELRSAIFGSKDYASDLRNRNFREMAELLHAAQKGGLSRAEIAETKLAKAVEAMRPFYAAVFNDNGDVTISSGHIQTKDWLKLSKVCASSIAEINGGGDT